MTHPSYIKICLLTSSPSTDLIWGKFTFCYIATNFNNDLLKFPDEQKDQHRTTLDFFSLVNLKLLQNQCKYPLYPIFHSWFLAQHLHFYDSWCFINTQSYFKLPKKKYFFHLLLSQVVLDFFNCNSVVWAITLAAKVLKPSWLIYYLISNPRIYTSAICSSSNSKILPNSARISSFTNTKRIFPVCRFVLAEG
mgnify:CR=1 FL=1